MNIGVVGLGIIGSRVARNWQKAGHAVRGWNRTPSRAKGLGLPLADTPGALARQSELLFVVVADPPALDAVVSGPNGIASVPLAGKVVLNAGTVSAAANQRADAEVRAARGEFLETPFTGSKTGAESGQLVFFVGGDAALLERVRPVLLQIGKAAVHFGAVGKASDAKLAMNLILANYMQSLAEGFLLALKSGVDMKTFADAFRLSAGWCPLAELKVPKILGSDFSPHFSLKHMGKDLGLALERAAETEADVPQTVHLKQLFDEALARGWGEEDFAVLYRAIAEPPR